MQVDKWTDKELFRLEQRIKKEYSNAQIDLTKYFDHYYNGWDEVKDGSKIHHAGLYERKEKEFKAYEEGKYHDPTGRYSDEEMFNRWLASQEGRGEHIELMMKQMDDRLVDAGKITQGYANGVLPKVWINNNNAVADLATESAMEQGIMGVRFDLVDEYTVKRLMEGSREVRPYKPIVLDIPKMSKYNRTKIQNAVLEGILAGDSIDKVASRLEKVVGMNRASAIRNARTAVTGAQSGGKQSRYEDLADKGCIATKIWVATEDDRTRPEHADADGQEVNYDEPFDVGGEEMMFPCDLSMGASDWNVYNCRCTTKAGKFTFTSILSDRAKQLDTIEIVDTDKDNNISTLKDIGDKPQRPMRSDYDDMQKYEEDRQKYKEQIKEYNERLDKYVQSEVDKPRTYDTREAVEKWCEQNNYRVDASVLENIDLRIMDDVIAVQEEMYSKYPFIKEWQDNLYPYGFGYQGDKSYIFEANTGLNFGFVWQNYEEALRGAVDELHSGFLTTGDGTIQTVIRHEFGHNIDSYISLEKFGTLKLRGDDPETFRRQEARKEYEKELSQLTKQYCKTEYAYTNTLESFAEGFAEYSSNPKSEYGRMFGEFINKWLNWS